MRNSTIFMSTGVDLNIAFSQIISSNEYTVLSSTKYNLRKNEYDIISTPEAKNIKSDQKKNVKNIS